MFLKKNVASCAYEFSIQTNEFLRWNSSGTWAAISAFSCDIDDILSVLSAVMEMQPVTPPGLMIK